MLKASLAMAFATAIALAPAYGQEKIDKAKEWCTDAHMQQMDDQVSKMTDTGKKKTAMNQLKKSKAEMKKGDMKGCVAHMEKAHKAMGM
jgi:hypothetical protein